MKYIINSEKKIVTQKATMEKPKLSAYCGPSSFPNWQDDNNKYEQHLASLKSFPAEWVTADQDGKEVELDKDFRLQYEMKGAVGWESISKEQYDSYDGLFPYPTRIVAVAIPAKVNYEPGVYSAMTEAGKNDMEERYGKLPAEKEGGGEFQKRVDDWMQVCFGAVISKDKQERNHRFIEEALELVQSCGATESECKQLVEYVYSRPVGEMNQEIGGVMVTLAALCLAQGANMTEAGETELKRIWTKVDKIREKQAAKPKHSPLPASPTAEPVSAEDILNSAIHSALVVHGIPEEDRVKIMDLIRRSLATSLPTHRSDGEAAKIKNSVMLHEAAHEYAKGITERYNGFEAGVNWVLDYLPQYQRQQVTDAIGRDEVERLIKTTINETTKAIISWVEKETIVTQKETGKSIRNVEITLVEECKPVSEYIFQALAKHGIKLTE